MAHASFTTPESAAAAAGSAGPSALHAAPQAVRRSMPAALSVMLGLLGAVFFTWVATKLFWFLLLVYLSCLFATLLEVPVSWLKARGIPRGVSSTVLILALAGLLLAVIIGGSAALYGQFQEVAGALQQLPDRINAWAAEFRKGHPAFQAVLQDFDAHRWLGELAGGPQLAAAAARGLWAGAGAGMAVVTAALVVLFMALYMTINGDAYLMALRRLLPRHARVEAARVMTTMALAHRGWFFASLCNIGSASLLSCVGLWLCGVPGAVILGVVAGLGELVPNLGPGLAALPAVLVTLVVAPARFLAVLAMFAVVQTIQGYGFSPHVMKHGVDLPPLVTIMAVVVMGVLFGALGVVVAIPLTADLVVLWNYVNSVMERTVLTNGQDSPPPAAGPTPLPLPEAPPAAAPPA